MPARQIDLRGALVADLPRGRIETREHQRLLALPAEWLDALLVRAPADAPRALGATLALALEADVRAALEGVLEPTPEDIAYALSVALAARGLGTVRFERWGDALSLVWRDPPGRSEAWHELVAASVAALLNTLTGLDVAAAPVGVERDELRVILASREVCDAARRLARDGKTLPQIVAGLERPAEDA